MSSGGQRGVDISGNGATGVGMRIMDASDFTIESRRKLMFVTNTAIATSNVAAWTGRNAFQNHMPNGNNFVQEFLRGQKECGCSNGQPAYQPNNITRFS
jgi:hypothetical protein